MLRNDLFYFVPYTKNNALFTELTVCRGQLGLSVETDGTLLLVFFMSILVVNFIKPSCS